MDFGNVKQDLDWDVWSAWTSLAMVCYFTACCMRKGCHSFICDTDQSHSNCMEWFKSAYGIPAAVKVTSTNGVAMICFQDGSSSPSNQPTFSWWGPHLLECKATMLWRETLYACWQFSWAPETCRSESPLFMPFENWSPTRIGLGKCPAVIRYCKCL